MSPSPLQGTAVDSPSTVAPAIPRHSRLPRQPAMATGYFGATMRDPRSREVWQHLRPLAVDRLPTTHGLHHFATGGLT